MPVPSSTIGGEFSEVVMRQFVACLFLAFMLAGRVPAFAQASPARVCVAEVETREPSISPTAVRDSLIKFLSKQKGLEAEEVPLDASDSARSDDAGQR